MDFIVLTIFPELFEPFWEHGIIKKAINQKIISATTLHIRHFAAGKHRVTDDKPYGGGCGMVMKPEPLAGAIREAQKRAPDAKTILLTPQGRVFDQKTAREFITFSSLILVCGRYEGIDERICQEFIDFEVSTGDYILTGGELAAMIVIDAITRLIPGALGGKDSAEMDSFSDGLLEHAHYTRPQNFEGQEPPTILLSGNHQAVEKWRLESSLIRTFLKRKDLLENRILNEHEIKILKKWGSDIDTIIRAQSSRGTDPLSSGK